MNTLKTDKNTKKWNKNKNWLFEITSVFEGMKSENYLKVIWIPSSDTWTLCRGRLGLNEDVNLFKMFFCSLFPHRLKTTSCKKFFMKENAMLRVICHQKLGISYEMRNRQSADCWLSLCRNKLVWLILFKQQQSVPCIFLWHVMGSNEAKASHFSTVSMTKKTKEKKNQKNPTYWSPINTKKQNKTPVEINSLW